MKRKYIISLIGLIILLLFVCGCNVNKSQETCDVLSISNIEEDVTFYMQGTVCVAHEENATHTLSLKCLEGFDYFYLVIKYDINQTEDSTIDDLKSECKVLYHDLIES